MWTRLALQLVALFAMVSAQGFISVRFASVGLRDWVTKYTASSECCLKLNCDVVSPRPWSINYKFNGVPIDTESDPNIRALESGSLLLCNGDPAIHSGRYRCEVTKGGARAYKEIQVSQFTFRQFPCCPSCLKEPRVDPITLQARPCLNIQDMGVRSHYNDQDQLCISITCNTQGSPTPLRFSFKYKSVSALQQEGVTVNGNTLQHCDIHDTGVSGMYTCEASNAVGCTVRKDIRIGLADGDQQTSPPTQSPDPVPLPCYDPGRLSNGDRHSSSGSGSSGLFPHGTVLAYTCHEGYGLVGPTIQACLNGTWSTESPTCEPVPCSDPGPIVNGHTDTRSSPFMQGDMLIYSCDAGYVQGSVLPVCQNGRWTATPVCGGVARFTKSVQGGCLALVCEATSSDFSVVITLAGGGSSIDPRHEGGRGQGSAVLRVCRVDPARDTGLATCTARHRLLEADVRSMCVGITDPEFSQVYQPPQLRDNDREPRIVAEPGLQFQRTEENCLAVRCTLASNEKPRITYIQREGLYILPTRFIRNARYTQQADNTVVICNVDYNTEAGNYLCDTYIPRETFRKNATEQYLRTVMEPPTSREATNDCESDLIQKRAEELDLQCRVTQASQKQEQLRKRLSEAETLNRPSLEVTRMQEQLTELKTQKSAVGNDMEDCQEKVRGVKSMIGPCR